MPKLLGMTQSGFDPASRFRFIQFIPYLEKAGWQVEHRPNRPDRQWSSSLPLRVARAIHYRLGRSVMKLNRVADLVRSSKFDVVFVNRDFAAEGAAFQQLFSPLMRKTVFDFDDAIFVGWREKLVRWMCKTAFWVTPGNPYLANYAAQFTNRLTIIPTVIDTEVYKPRDYRRGAVQRVPRIGWSGSDQSIRTTLVPYLPMLEALQRRTEFELIVITNSKPELPSTLRWKYVPWKPENEASMEAHLDIGIMPLVSDEFQKGKCALKLLQYMAAGLPTVASPVGVNCEVLLHRTTGLFASTPGEWHDALNCLLHNRQLGAAMGEAGRKRCETDYSIRRWLPVLLEILEKTCAEKQLRTASLR